MRRWPVLAIFLLLAACAAPPGARFAPRDFADLPGWEQDDLRDTGAALAHGCARLKARPEWAAACRDLPDDPAQRRVFITARFKPWQILDGDAAEGLFTGYYEASLRGSRTQHGRYQIPVYGRPADLAVAELGLFKPELKGQSITGRVDRGRFIPYFDRAQITQAGLRDAPVLLWVDDAVDLFFLQVQGSGRVQLDDGTTMRLGYATQNGRPYVAIGRVLKDQGHLPPDQVTMATIRNWLRDHPAQRDAILNTNPSYVFFQPGIEAGPVGAMGTVLTPGRSMAVDRARIPLGSFLWLDCDHPDATQGRMQRLTVAEDVGGAIKGAVRGDLFWGYGDDAATQAGNMQSRGRLYVLWPQGSAPGNQADGG
ncbi:MAG: murein transglycosylase A [Alphaproteobacteria bacterium]